MSAESMEAGVGEAAQGEAPAAVEAREVEEGAVAASIPTPFH